MQRHDPPHPDPLPPEGRRGRAAANDLKATLVQRATALGFDAVRVAPAALAPEIGAGLEAWLGRGSHGEMAWMAHEPGRRRDPRGLWPEARSVVVLGTNYGPSSNPLDALADRDRGVVSVYAHGTDYHDLVKKRLKALARWLHVETGVELKVFVDTAPVME
ncbi:MAG TPA: QueG-associated DUF1730 domain-containing protein, partial [Stellaceae bacterium]|nr:QueG-associated DUF1730 domain-containing protein [Stellaceae bacterium]